MSVPLYTKHRPRKFSDIAQPQAVPVWQAQIKTDTSVQSYLFAGSSGTGKAQPIDAEVLTPTGYKKIGSIKINDKVIGSDGFPKNVIGIYPQGVKPVFKITFSDRTSTECCAEHLWQAQTKSDRAAYNGRGRTGKIYTTNELLENIKSKSFFIPLVKAIKFKHKKLLIDPYIMGVLLGDGTFCMGGILISSMDEEILEYLRNNLPNKHKLVKKQEKGCDYRISTGNTGQVVKNVFVQEIRKLGLFNTHSDTKFIPQDYKINSIEKRLRILQGLMDSDGCCSKDGTNSVFYSTSEILSNDVKFLVQSLGGKATVCNKQTFFTYNGTKKMGKPSFAVHISLPPEYVPFSLKRKLEKFKKRSLYFPIRKIKNIEYTKDKECVCIRIDSEDHLYCTNDCILTHNTTSARVYAMALLCENLDKENAEPCGVCRSCVAIIEDRNRDVDEVNCATNGGVDEVRAMIAEKINFAPSGKFKIFILDECQQLTKQAQSALLKIIEEPPAYVKFFLCTSEAQKVDPAIKGRCEFYNITRVSDKDARIILQKVVKKESISVENDEALELIIQTANGNIRQALTILGQVASLGVTEQNVRLILGRAPKKIALDLLSSIGSCNRTNAFRVIDTANSEGRNLPTVIEDAVRFLMDMIAHKLIKKPIDADVLETFALFQEYKIITLTSTALLNITKEIRQNVPTDLVIQIGLLNIIDEVAKVKAKDEAKKIEIQKRE